MTSFTTESLRSAEGRKTKPTGEAHAVINHSSQALYTLTLCCYDRSRVV